MTSLRSTLLALTLTLAPLFVRAQPAIHCITPDPATGSSKAVLFTDRALIHTTQILPDAGGTPAEQAAGALRRLQTILKEAGHADATAVRLEWCVQDNATRVAVQQVMAREFSGAHKPAATFVAGKMRDPKISLALNAIAVARPNANVAKPTIVPTSLGNVSLLPRGGVTQVSGDLVKGATTREYAKNTLASLLKSLEFLHLTKADAVQFKVFIQPIEEAGHVIEAFQEVFGGAAATPPITFVEWQGAQPSLEIEMVAAATPTQAGAVAHGVSYLTPTGMTEPTVYCRVAAANSPSHIYVSTLTSTKPGDGAFQERDIYAQLQVILSQCNGNFDQLVKATYYTSDNDGSKGLVDLRPSLYNPKRPPAASKAGVTGTAFEGRTLSVDMIAVPR